MRRSESLTAFGAAPLKHQTAVFRRHPRAESVRFGAAAIVGLKGSLRHRQQFSSSGKRPSLATPECDVKEGALLLLSHIEPEVHYIAFLHDVVFAFQP